MTEIIGRARATERGYYPDDGVHFRLIEEGEVFNLVEGRGEGRWFEVLELDDQAEAKPKVEAKPKTEVKPKAKPKPATQVPAPGGDDGIV